MATYAWKTIQSTDVLILGGGLAGLNAAIGAAESGAQVLVKEIKVRPEPESKLLEEERLRI